MDRQVADESISFNVHKHTSGLQQVGDDAPAKENDDTPSMQDALFRVVLSRRQGVAWTSTFEQFGRFDLNGIASSVDDTGNDTAARAQTGK